MGSFAVQLLPVDKPDACVAGARHVHGAAPMQAMCWLQGSCCTCIMVAISGAVAAVLAVADPLKPEARGVVAALAQRGLAVHLVTGDNWRTARAIAEQLAIVNVCAECLPGAKADKIKVPWPHPPHSYSLCS